MLESIHESALRLASRIAKQYSALPQTEAVALAGSHTTHVSDPGSDIDLYVYWQTEIPIEARRAIAETTATRSEVDNRFWESGDEWIDKATDIRVDAMFRHTRWIEEQLERTLDRHEASIGYSTCLWHNVMTSKPLFDKRGWFAGLQAKARQPYPETLKHRIVDKNYPILRDNLSSYANQLSNAARRGDKVSLNHRTAAFLASYFDIVFAVNRLPHPGEKRVLEIAAAQCNELPEDMDYQVNRLLSMATSDGDIAGSANALICRLDELLRKQALLKPRPE